MRVDAGFTLRGFCREMGLDGGNWSRIEREVSKPPTDEAFYFRRYSDLTTGLIYQ